MTDPPVRSIRLHKWLPRCGFGGKAVAESLIRAGHVSINGLPCLSISQAIDPSADEVTVDGIPLQAVAAFTCILAHKPKGCVTTTRDPEGRRTVFELLPDSGLPRLFPVGRLDYNSEGALLLTNDGRLARSLLHPQYHVSKVYHVKLRGIIYDTDPGLEKLRQGVTLEDGPVAPTPVRVVALRTRATWVEIILTEGRNRQVRRMCAAIDRQVVKLRRVAIGPLLLEPLPCRAWRFLSADEVSALYQASTGCPPPSSWKAAFVPGQEVHYSPRLRGLPGIPEFLPSLPYPYES